MAKELIGFDRFFRTHYLVHFSYCLCDRMINVGTKTA